MFGYTVNISTGNVIGYWDLVSKPVDANGLQYIECDEGEKPPVYEEPVSYYNADDLITWARQQVFVADLIPHFAAFLDFANKATQVSYTNFIAYATAVGLESTANLIVAKAIELGADLEVS